MNGQTEENLALVAYVGSLSEDRVICRRLIQSILALMFFQLWLNVVKTISLTLVLLIN